MTLNAWMGQADAADMVRLVRENGVALLAVQELSPALERRLDAEGLGGLLPYRISHTMGGASGGGVYSSRPLVRLDSVAGSAFHMPTLQVPVAAGGRPVALAVTNVHTQAPVEAGPGGGAANWPLWAACRPSRERAAAGRFQRHARPRRVPPDAGRRPGQGRRDRQPRGRGGRGPGPSGPTWPKDGQPLPGVVIDHIVTSPQVRSRGYSVQAVAGTDHAAVLATLSVPAGG